MASFSEAFWRLRSEWADAHKLEADLAKLPAGAPERPGLKDKLRMANDTLANLLASYFGAAYQQLGVDLPAGAGPAAGEVTGNYLRELQALVNQLVEANSLWACIEQRLAGPTPPEGWRARALFAFRLLFSWPARLLRRAGCPPYAVSTHAHLRSFAAALLGTLVWQLFLGGGGWAASFWGDWAASFPAASLWLAMALCVACWAALSWVLKHNLLQSRQELDALTGHKNAMLDKRNELSADAPSLARLANAAFIVLEGRAARAQQALQAAEAGQQGLRLWG